MNFNDLIIFLVRFVLNDFCIDKCYTSFVFRHNIQTVVRGARNVLAQVHLTVGHIVVA